MLKYESAQHFHDSVAKISKETIGEILELMGRLSILVDAASSTELSIFNTYGEVEEMVYPEFLTSNLEEVKK
jgi:hypothetical protein